jgi:hypothetical protein
MPILLEITPHLNIATFFRQCSRCTHLIGPFTTSQLHSISHDISCKTCASTLRTIARAHTKKY